ncbi:MAG: alkyl sulfatase dimerization domain-containing protein [Pseudomonadales bacterium]
MSTHEKGPHDQAPPGAPKPATRYTVEHQKRTREELPFEEDTRSFENAGRGFIATLTPLTIPHDAGPRRPPAYDLSKMGFLDGRAPDTVNPSLWRQARLNARFNGLYEVTEGIYQVRSFDIANMTLIRGEHGWIVVDPLTSSEAARAALALADRELGERPVVAVIYTHSHVDHFAGALGVISPEAAESGEVRVIAPEHFVDEALSENVLAGNVMNRRATYMYGNLLTPSPTGFVTTGLGAALSMGSTGFIVPNDLVRETGERRLIDGIEFEFQMTPGSEAPAEFVFYLPEHRALCMSEITSHHMHNVYTLRGAQVRDALAWSSQINESLERFGSRLETLFACHHWPIWGREEACDYLASQRDLYKYIHDQTLRLANHGFTKEEIAEQMRLPASLGRNFSNRGYYGSLYHNSCAVYVKYLGFFDGNPATLHRLPPSQAGRRYVEFMGGADALLVKAQSCFDQGEYRWVAEVLNHLVMSDPDNAPGRALLADALEQLGYQAESAVWRNFYLTGALELREPTTTSSRFSASEGMARGMPLDNLFQAMAVRLNGPRAEGLVMKLNLEFTDLDRPYLLTIENSVLHVTGDRRSDHADASLTCTSLNFKRLMLGVVEAPELLDKKDLEVSGSPEVLVKFTGLFDRFARRFPIMTPRAFTD